MKKLLALLCLFEYSEHAIAQFTYAVPPVAKTEIHWRIIHGDSVLDNYYWMYDYFGKGPDSTNAVDYLVAENKYLDTSMQFTKTFQANLFTEMKNRIKENDETPPVFHNGYYYYKRTDEGKQYYKYCRKKGSLNATEEILLDVDKMAEGYAFCDARGYAISIDKKWMAYGVDTVGRGVYTIYIKNLETGEIEKENISNTEGDPCWANDNKILFYTSKNPKTFLKEKIYRHTLSTLSSADSMVYEEKDNSNYVFLSKSKNDKYILILSRGTLSSETRIIDADKPFSACKLFQPRMKNVLYYVIPLDNKFLIRTNKDGAKNFKLMECSPDHTSESNWKEMVPNKKDILIEGVEPFKDFIVLSERKDALIRFHVIRLKDNIEYAVEFGESAYTYISSNPEYNSSTFRYEYSSLITPNSVYDYDMKAKVKQLIKRQEILGGYKSDDYVSERLHAVARDGTLIPISLIYKKGFKKNGQAPLLMNGYGSYGVSWDPAFDSGLLSLLNRGFAFAIAHVRGGQEMGRYWYEDGKLMKKKNTFTDFIDCGKYLVKEKYASSSHLYAIGLSAGGLVMGAITTMAPELWHGVIAQVPFVDVVNSMLNESIPLTTNEFNEWGNPKEKAAYFYMKSYSPYENVARRNYPNLLVETGLHDSKVLYFEPSKWVAKLRAIKTDKNILLLHTDMDFGHNGASGRFDYLKDVSLEYAFLCTLEGIDK
jgi:oligopeptidase B